MNHHTGLILQKGQNKNRKVGIDFGNAYCKVATYREEITITREEFEADIDRIILVGGASQMPQVAKKLEETWHKPISSWGHKQAVALGAAFRAKDL